MQLTLKNVNLIRDAHINLNGLTIIAGENDTGKSTIGKLLFTIIKAFNQYNNTLSEDKKINLQQRIEDIYLQVRKTFHFEDNINLKKTFFPANFFAEIMKIINSSTPDYQSNEIESIFEQKIYELNNSIILPKATQNLDNITADLQRFKSTLIDLLNKNNLEEKITPILNKLLSAEFNSELTPKQDRQGKTQLILTESDNPICTIEIGDNQVDSLLIEDSLLFNDAHFIETPIILQLYDLINSTDLTNSTTRSTTRLAFHLTDLIAKLKNIQYFSGKIINENDALFDLLKQSNELMQGNFNFDDIDQDFIFQRKNKKIRIYQLNLSIPHQASKHLVLFSYSCRQICWTIKVY